MNFTSSFMVHLLNKLMVADYIFESCYCSYYDCIYECLENKISKTEKCLVMMTTLLAITVLFRFGGII